MLIESSLSFNRYLLIIPTIYLIRLSLIYPKVYSHISFFKKNKLLLLSILILIFGIIRNNVSSIRAIDNFLKIYVFVSFIFIITVFIRSYFNAFYYSEKKIYNILLIIITPFFLFSLINLVFFFLSIKGEQDFVTGEAVFLQNIGIYIDRVKFYLALGTNNYGSIVGVFFTMCCTYIVLFKRNLFITLAFFTFLITILLTDTRASIFYSILLLFFIILFSKKILRIKYAKWFPYMMFIGPFLLILSFTFLGSDSLFIREGEDFQTGNHRLLIWGISLNDLSSFKFIQLIGYGEYGILQTSSANKLSYLMNRDEYYFLHPHNSLIVSIIDNGYLGLLTYFLLIYNAIKSIVNNWEYLKYLQLILLSAFLYFILIGLTETIYGFYYPNSNNIFYSFIILQVVTSEYIIKSKKNYE